MSLQWENRSEHEKRIDEAIAAFYEAREQGRPFDRADFIARFPDLTDDLNRFFADQAAFENETAVALLKGKGSNVGPVVASSDMLTLPPLATSSECTALHAGETRYFGDYELIKEIARGGMGIVYKARQRSLNRMVALKMILAGELAGDDQVRRFRVEAEAAAALDHPNVLPIYEIGQHQGQHYFSMKLALGGSLAAHKAALVGKPAAVAALMATLARAVEHAHSHGLLHRDLKPGNVLLDSDGTPFVTDFGLVKQAGVDDLTRTGAILGSPSYMSPEQARGERGLTPAVDVYALGAILYELLTGRPPFQGPTPFDVIIEVMEREPAHPRAVNASADRDLSLIALKCLEKDPKRRYPSAAALAEDLDRWLIGEPVTARRRAGLRRVVAWARREPGLACRLAVIGLCAAIVHVKYRLDPAVGFGEHLRIMAILAGWAVISVGCQALLRGNRYVEGVVAAWLAADAGVMTGLLILDDSHESPLVVVYGLFVAASGVWLSRWLVWFATAAAVVGYLVLVGAAAARHALTGAPHHHAIAAISLVAIGAVVAYQVRRARLLSRFESSRTRPTS